jgi:hypothetical protein
VVHDFFEMILNELHSFCIRSRMSSQPLQLLPPPHPLSRLQETSAVTVAQSSLQTNDDTKDEAVPEETSAVMPEHSRLQKNDDMKDMLEMSRANF